MTGDLQATLWFNEYITPWDLYAHGITLLKCSSNSRCR